MAAVAAAVTVAANASKLAKVSSAVATLDAGGWDWFGLTCEGGGRRNEMTISNALNHDVELVKLYLHWGKVKVPPEPFLRANYEDHVLFHNAGSWAATGSSGIVTYQLQHNTKLHIMWDCPYNFDYSDNFIGLMLTSSLKWKNPDKMLFKYMYQDCDLPAFTPKAESRYDLVCCGPGKGGSHEAGGKKPWGHMRPCKVSNAHYKVLATMGDRHATASKITILHADVHP